MRIRSEFPEINVLISIDVFVLCQYAMLFIFTVVYLFFDSFFHENLTKKNYQGIDLEYLYCYRGKNKKVHCCILVVICEN